MQKNKFFFNFEKCVFAKHEVNYLERIITENKIKAAISKLKMIKDKEFSKFIKGLQKLLIMNNKLV